MLAKKQSALKKLCLMTFKAYQQQVVKNAQAMAEVFISRVVMMWFQAVQTTIYSYCLLIKQEDVTGKDADAWLGAAHITVNKNAVPNDPRSPFVTSGIRIGTPAVTTRGFGEAEVRDLAAWIADIIDSKGNEQVIADVKLKLKRFVLNSQFMQTNSF